MGNSTTHARNGSITNAWTFFAHACARDRKGLGWLRGLRADFAWVDALLLERRFDQSQSLPLLAAKRDAERYAARRRKMNVAPRSQQLRLCDNTCLVRRSVTRA
jgi:hypothetical protein